MEEGASKRRSEAHSPTDRFPARWRKDFVIQCLEVPESGARSVARSQTPGTGLRHWRKVPESDARSQTPSTGLRHWRKVPESDARSEARSQTPSTGLRHWKKVPESGARV